jgi:hypothetical protein
MLSLKKSTPMPLRPVSMCSDRGMLRSCAAAQNRSQSGGLWGRSSGASAQIIAPFISFLTSTRLALKPSEYIKRQVYATFINEPVFVSELHRYSPDKIMWSSDYPHLAATFPRSQQFIEQAFGRITPEQKRKIVHDTAGRVYGIE